MLIILAVSSLIVFLAVLGYHSLCRLRSFKTLTFTTSKGMMTSRQKRCHSIMTEQTTNYCVATILHYSVIQTPILVTEFLSNLSS